MATFQRFRLVPIGDETIDEKDDWLGLKDAKERRKRQNRLNQRAARRRQRLHLAKEHESEGATAVVIHPGTTAAPIAQHGRPVVPPNQVYFPLSPDHKLLYVIVLNVSRAVITNYFILCAIAPTSSSSCDGRRIFTLDDFTGAPRNLDGTLAVPPAFRPTKLQGEVAHPGWIDLFPSPQMRDNLILAVEEYKIDEDAILADLIGDIFESLGCAIGDIEHGPEHREKYRQEYYSRKENEAKTLSSSSSSSSSSTSSSSSSSSASISDTPSITFPLTPEQQEKLRTYVPSSSTELGILSWSDPWDISGWEFTEKFVSKWGFLLQGCPDVVNAANRWRALRGEEPLVVEL